MPKMKTHKATAKRFRKTATGRWLRRRANRIHRHTKAPRAKRALDKEQAVDRSDERRIEKLLPYS